MSLRRIRVLLEVFNWFIGAPLAADGPRSPASLTAFPRDAAAFDSPGRPQGEGCEALPPGRLCRLRLGARPADDGLRVHLFARVRRRSRLGLVPLAPVSLLTVRLPAVRRHGFGLATWCPEGAAPHAYRLYDVLHSVQVSCKNDEKCVKLRGQQRTGRACHDGGTTGDTKARGKTSQL